MMTGTGLCLITPKEMSFPSNSSAIKWWSDPILLPDQAALAKIVVAAVLRLQHLVHAAVATRFAGRLLL